MHDAAEIDSCVTGIHLCGCSLSAFRVFFQAVSLPAQLRWSGECIHYTKFRNDLQGLLYARYDVFSIPSHACNLTGLQRMKEPPRHRQQQPKLASFILHYTKLDAFPQESYPILKIEKRPRIWYLHPTTNRVKIGTISYREVSQPT